MMLRVTLLLAVLGLAMSSGCGSDTPAPPAELPAHADASNDELAVYAAVFDSLYRQDGRVDTILIHRSTLELLSVFENEPTPASVTQRLRLLAGVPAVAIDDYLRANTTRAVLPDSLPMRRPYRVVDPQSAGPIPDAPVPYSFSFSRVGFSASRDTAVVSLAFNCPLCGEGRSVLLVRAGATWRVIETSVNWVS